MGGPDLARASVSCEGGDASAPASLHDEVECERPFEHRDRRAPHRLDERALDLGARRGAACVHDARKGVTSLACELEASVGRTIERGTHGDELRDPVRSLVDEHAHGFDVAQTGSGRERVGEMQVRGVRVARQHGRDAALRPARRGLIELGLRQHADPQPQRIGRAHGRGQTRDAAAEDEEIEVDVRVHRRSPPVTARSRRHCR